MRRVHERGPSFFQAGLIALAVTALGIWFAFGGGIPFRHHYQLRAQFRYTSNLLPRSPVRIAGVTVGEVESVRKAAPGSKLSLVTMRLKREALPIHRDAQLAIRPRVFLEGNYYVDIKPGTPSAPLVSDGDVIPAARTTTPVQVTQLLSSLQSDTRAQLQTVLQELDSGLSGAGARGYRRSIRWWRDSYRNSALAADASMGQAPHDLSRYIAATGKINDRLDADPAAVKGLITDFDTTAAALASQDAALAAAIGELPRTLRAALPALRSIENSLPAVDGFVRDAIPAARSVPATADASLPFLRQAKPLMSRAELGGLAQRLRGAVPALARLERTSVPLLESTRAASSCQNEVIIPWANDKVPDDRFPASGPVFEEGVKWLPGIAGESRSGDANGQWFRGLVAAGSESVGFGDGRFAQALLPILGFNPPPPASPPPLEPTVPCETQQRPDLSSKALGPPPQWRSSLRTPAAKARYERAKAAAVKLAKRFQRSGR